MDANHWVWRKRLWAVLFCVFAFFVLMLSALPVLARAREQSRRSSCGNNLGNLVKCCMLYADAHDGQWPEKLSQLYPNYVRDIRVFNCPSALGPKVLTAEDIDTKCSYEYHPERMLTEGVSVGVLLDKPENHAGTGKGRNVAIGAGSVEWWDDGDARATRDVSDRRPDN